MSTLNTTNLKNASSGSNNLVLGSSGQTTINGDLLFNSGYGSAATAYGCRAWVNFNGTGTVAIRASGNVSSITDNGVGTYTVNFTTAMPDANYAIVAVAGESNQLGISSPRVYQTGSVGVFTGAVYNQASDYSLINIAIFR